MKKVLFLVNHDIVIYNFRKEIVEKLIEDGNEVIISSPYGERIDKLIQMGCKYEPINLERHGKNPFKDFLLIKNYKKLIKKVNPDIIFSFTIKPNIYGAIAAKKYKKPIVVNITGLGQAVENKSLLQRMIIKMYKYSFKHVQTIFVQNEENKSFFDTNNIYPDKVKLLPGSGVNLEQFSVIDYPNNDIIKFVFLSRIMKEKGTDQYLEMAKYIKNKYKNTEFHICGFCEEQYQDILKEYQANNIIIYHGLVMDTREILKDMNCTIHPTYYPEGMSNVLLESLAVGRPIITTDRSGCREIVDDNINGFMVKQKDTNSLIEAVEKFLKLDNNTKKQMGLNGRSKVEKYFDRNIVVNAYLKEIN